MAKSAYEILDICKNDIDYANRHRYGLTAEELVEIALHRNFKFAPGISDAILDAYALGLARGIHCQRNRSKN